LVFCIAFVIYVGCIDYLLTFKKKKKNENHGKEIKKIQM
jgi:hypothetical protein